MAIRPIIHAASSASTMESTCRGETVGRTTLEKGERERPPERFVSNSALRSGKSTETAFALFTRLLPLPILHSEIEALITVASGHRPRLAPPRRAWSEIVAPPREPGVLRQGGSRTLLRLE